MKKKTLRILIDDDELVPVYASKAAAGADLHSASREEITVDPGETALIPTGIRMEIPEGYEVQIRPRSGLAFKYQITVLNTPGTIDADYRGEVKVLLINHGKEPFVITYGMRIAQILLTPVLQAEFQIENALAATVRGEGGFGHTGTH
ncbi:MAG: Deoxyuridine 5'-triphosphate nucleotidohydrolase [Chlamydiae bacterium]|nr:Deoxyuridine 5'-triphosphate nucleotidohydrolase [Chlamydiota bacterium]